MGVTWGDADGDGALDLHVAATGEQRLLLADAAGYYDAAAARGLGEMDVAQMAWGAALGDVDNDGRADLIVATSDFFGAAMRGWPLWWFTQEEDGTLTEEGASRGLPEDAATRGVVVRELNGDGVPDVIVGDALRSPRAWFSTGCTARGWLDVTAPSGTVVRVTAGDESWVALATSDAGWASSGPSRAHFGLGDIATVDTVVLEVPGVGTVTQRGPFAANRTIGWAP